MLLDHHNFLRGVFEWTVTTADQWTSTGGGEKSFQLLMCSFLFSISSSKHTVRIDKRDQLKSRAEAEGCALGAEIVTRGIIAPV